MTGARRSNAVEQFFEASRERWADSTEALYRYYLTDLVRIVGEIGPTSTTADLRHWLDSHPRWGNSSRYQAIEAARHFFRWTVGQANSPAEALRLPRRPMRPQRTLKEAELAKLVGACDTSMPKGIRDLAIIVTLLDCGLRASELVRLQACDVDLEERRLQVITKGSRLQGKVFSLYTANQIAKWISVRPSIALPTATTLFVGIGGLHPGTHMSRDGLRVTLYKLGRKAGIGPVSPHALRRSFAVIAHRAKAPTRMVQLWGGWSDLKLVERYTQTLELDPDDFEPHSPVNRVMGLSS